MPHTTTSVSMVNDATNNALSMEANLITPPSASYPGATLSDSIIGPQPASELFPLWFLCHWAPNGTTMQPRHLSRE